MRYRKEIDGDYAFGCGDNSYLADSPQAVAQAVRSRLMLWRGEWFLDRDEGTPWGSSVLGKQAPELYALAVRDRISGTPGVSSVIEFTTKNESETRRLRFSAKLATVYGEVTVDV
jgi:hypothetical protein